MTPPETAAPDRPFEEPWQAKAFALAVHLSARGLFSWREWTEAFAEVPRAETASRESSEATAYWRNWVLTLERMLVARGFATAEMLAELTAAWDEAFHTTPHAQPVLLPDRTLRAIAAASEK